MNFPDTLRIHTHSRNGTVLLMVQDRCGVATDGGHKQTNIKRVVYIIRLPAIHLYTLYTIARIRYYTLYYYAMGLHALRGLVNRRASQPASGISALHASPQETCCAGWHCEAGSRPKAPGIPPQGTQDPAPTHPESRPKAPGIPPQGTRDRAPRHPGSMIRDGTGTG